MDRRRGGSPGWRTFALALALSVGCAPVDGHGEAESAIHGEVTIPLRTIEFAGHRYVAEADVGVGKPVRLMIHGNARVFLMVTHEVGERLTGRPVPKLEEYGYSAKGKGSIDVPWLRIGNRRLTDLRAVPVFDYVPDGKSPVQGMVGIPFLKSQRAAVDFSRDVLILGVDVDSVPSAPLLARGYRHVPMTEDANGRIVVQMYFPALGRVLPITPSTVAEALTLHRPTFAGRLAMTRDSTESDRSPSRTSPALFHADRVAFEIAGSAFNARASLEDFAEYANVPETRLGSLGMLGYDWMKSHGAILDYANRILYFRP
jgi:hypothetical protein